MNDAAAIAYVRLRTLLRSEELQPGERVGDERSLAAALGVPRAALRAALTRLEDEGAVRRVIGRAGGVLVADGRIERHLNTTESLPVIARYQGIEVTTVVLRAALAVAGPRERRLLGLPEGATVHQLLRLRSAAGHPLSVESSVLPADLFPGLGDQDLSSLYSTLRTVYGVWPSYSDETLEVDAADPENAELLGVPPGTPVVRVRRAATGQRGRPIEIGEEVFLADRMRFHLRRYGRTVTHPEPSHAMPTTAPTAGERTPAATEGKSR
ncbi:GntR family transcriptional regulator [Actinotalea sp. M2MS4P-6]|uniref:GntR family transcriptional regulator n=1 Tax=Actinotalea sp. M2MS4P-6 TaxID=2983762 RepID=UPI0021E45FED|nr:GntR family transcriptional regulator [Actinotalea sp. M2MS4P-6]MCV2392944.1 GntR family transcriptional regulator [Actinotalea sp. M2MS4P-6]